MLTTLLTTARPDPSTELTHVQMAGDSPAPATPSPPAVAPPDEEVGDEGVPQSDAGDDSIEVDLPGDGHPSGPESRQPPVAAGTAPAA